MEVQQAKLNGLYQMTMVFWSGQGRISMTGEKKKPIHVIAISKFKARCLSLLQEVSKTKTPLRVTRRGKAIADVVPASSEGDERSWIGSLSGSVDIVGDVVSPVIDTESMEALKR